jgi:tetratricopeptide (TPR) repeat protein
LLVSVTTSPSGQTPSAGLPQSPAALAFETGRYDEVDKLLEASNDQPSVVLRARAHIARGRYPQAEKLLAATVAASPVGDAALELGQLHLYLGRRDEGTRILQTVLVRGPENTASDLVRLGLAARALGRFQDANSYLRDATRLAPQDAVVNTAWGELFLEKYNRADALKSFQAALKANANYPAAQLGFARTIVDEDPPAAKAAVEAALKINPNYVPAHLLIAEPFRRRSRSTPTASRRAPSTARSHTSRAGPQISRPSSRVSSPSTPPTPTRIGRPGITPRATTGSMRP